jgi:cell division protein FtsI (penicillin-binding protein 3)
MSVADIITVSSNIGAIKMGQELGYGSFYHYLKAFGFGEKTGIRLLGERGGFVRPEKAAKPIDQANLYFGQGMTVTSLQLAMAMSALANGGRLMRPYVVGRIVDRSGKVLEETKPKAIRRVISAATARKVKKILEGVVSEDGTAPKAAIAGFPSAGKTGTSQKVNPRTKSYSRTKHIASFIGFSPADTPKLVISIMIDEPQGVYYGGPVAGPVFSEVGTWALNYLRVTPRRVFASMRTELQDRVRKEVFAAQDQDAGFPLKTVRSRINKDLLPDFRGLGMRQVLKEGSALGLSVVLDGTGLAVSQDPPPGALLKKIREVKVRFKPPA